LLFLKLKDRGVTLYWRVPLVDTSETFPLVFAKQWIVQMYFFVLRAVCVADIAVVAVTAGALSPVRHAM
jgi:hypothetical protein